MTRHFLVARVADAVVIREIDPAQHPTTVQTGSTLDRRSAWDRAIAWAKPAPRALDWRAKRAVPVQFQAIDGTVTEVAPAQRTPKPEPKPTPAAVPATTSLPWE